MPSRLTVSQPQSSIDHSSPPVGTSPESTGVKDPLSGLNVPLRRIPWHPALRLRLTVWIVLVSVVIQLTFGLVILLFQNRAVDALVAAELRDRYNTLRSATAAIKHPIDDRFLSERSESLIRSHMFDRVAVTVVGRDNAVLASSTRPAIIPAAFSPADGTIQRLKDSPSLFPGEASFPSLVINEPLRIFDGSTVQLIVMTPDRYAADLASLTGRVGLIGLALGTLATGVAAWLMSGLAVAHLRELPALAGSLAPDRLSNGPEQPPASRELSEFQAALAQTRDRLKAALSAQERFISNASHELKTPIAVLLTEAQTIDRASLNPEGRAFVQSVVDEMRRLGQMVEGFLTLTKIRGGKSAGRQSRVSLKEILLEALSTSKSALARSGVTVEPSLLEEAGTDTEPLVLGNPELLRAMFENLIRNAVRYSPRASRVAIGITRSGSLLEVSFHDRGADVPTELHGRLFDRFEEHADSRVKGRHNSVALSIALGIAELHGGSISVNSPAEGGCRFTVGLPIASEADPEHLPQSASWSSA